MGKSVQKTLKCPKACDKFSESDLKALNVTCSQDAQGAMSQPQGLPLHERLRSIQEHKITLTCTYVERHILIM